MDKIEAIEILELVGAGFNPKTKKKINCIILKQSEILQALFIAINELKNNIKSDIIIVDDSINNESKNSLQQIVFDTMGIQLPIQSGRLNQLGWFPVGTTVCNCPKCGEVLFGFRKSYLSANKKYYYWALICKKCVNVYSPSQLDDASRKALYQSSEFRPGKDLQNN